MSQDDETLIFYSAEAQAYTARIPGPNHHLEHFMAQLRPGSRILELGCGAGQDSETMIARGFDVTPTDGTPEIAQAAERRLGRPVPVLLFSDIDAVAAYDGIWANACLLHVPREALGRIIGLIHKALKPGGIFHASYKSGSAEGRDRFNRYFNYPTAEWLRHIYGTDWHNIEIHDVLGSGYDNQLTNWLHATAIK